MDHQLEDEHFVAIPKSITSINNKCRSIYSRGGKIDYLLKFLSKKNPLQPCCQLLLCISIPSFIASRLQFPSLSGLDGTLHRRSQISHIWRIYKTIANISKLVLTQNYRETVGLDGTREAKYLLFGGFRKLLRGLFFVPLFRSILQDFRLEWQISHNWF